MQSRYLKLAWFGVPCGTACSAQERQRGSKPTSPIEGHGGAVGRTDIQLNAQESVRLSRATAIYRFMVRIIPKLEQRGVQWVVENPWRSLLWNIPEVQALLERPGIQDVDYTACIVCSERDKRQRLRGHTAQRFLF